MRHAFGNSFHLQRCGMPNLLLIRFYISADSPGGGPCFIFLCRLMSRLRTLEKVGLSLYGAQCKRTTRFFLPSGFLVKTIIDTNSKNHSQWTLNNHANFSTKSVLMSLSEPARVHLQPFMVQSSITLLPGLKYSSRGLQDSRMGAKAFQCD